MTKHLILFICFVLAGFFTYAQGDMPVVVINTSGKVKFTDPPATKKKKLTAGTAITRNATLKLSGKAAVNLYYNGKFQKLDKKGKYQLAEVFQGDSPFKSLSFSSAFGNELMASTGGGKSGGKDGGDGWGKKEFGLINIMPFGGKLIGPEAIFEWSATQGENAYKFRLYDSRNDQLIHEQVVKDTAVRLDLSKMKIQPGADYYWNVSAQSDARNYSEQSVFSYQKEASKKEALDKIKQLPDYKEGGPVLQSLMEAVALDRARMYYDANATYKKALATHPGHLLIVKMYASFLRKHDLGPLAIKVMKSK